MNLRIDAGPSEPVRAVLLPAREAGAAYPGAAYPGAAEGEAVRRRSDGVLTPAEAARCRARGRALGYDPVQAGWVPLDCEDDIDLADVPDHPASPAGPDAGEAEGTVALPGRAGLALRPWRAGDAGRLAALLSAPEVWRHLPEGYPGPIDAAAAAGLIVLSGAGHHRVRAILRDGVPVGQVRLLPGAAGTGSGAGAGTGAAAAGAAGAEAEISYWLGRDAWGQGIASAAVAAFTAASFARDPGLGRIFARVHRENAASVRVLGKAGYRLRGPDPADPVWLVLDIARPG
jgi:RimJ/RimL family protein N-acetyltransferase